MYCFKFSDENSFGLQRIEEIISWVKLIILQDVFTQVTVYLS